MPPTAPPPIDVPTAVAAVELVREGVSPDRAPGLTWPLRFLLAFVVVGFLWNIAQLPGSNPGITRTMAWTMLALSALAFGLAGPAGSWWAKARLRRRAAWVAKSPHQWPGFWFETPRRRAIGFPFAFGILVYVLAVSGDVDARSARKGRRSRDAPRTARDLMGVEVAGIMVAACGAALCGVVGALSWLNHRRFGTSRLVPSQAQLQGGDVLSAMLEASPRLARAREVRFELREKLHNSALGSTILPGHPAAIWASQAVPSSAFGAVPGLTLVPVALQVPVDARPSFEESQFGLHLTPLGLVVGYRDRAQVWELRASADVDGVRYCADFVLRVVSADAVPPEWRPAGASPE